MYLANKETEDELLDIYNGLHIAMENLIRQRNYEEAERVIRIVDAKMSNLINSIKVVRP